MPGRLIDQGNGDRYPGNVSINSGGVAFAGEVVGQQNVPGIEDSLGAVTQADLRLPFQRNHELAAGRYVDGDGFVSINDITGAVSNFGLSGARPD